MLQNSGFYGDLVYKFKIIVAKSYFSDQLKKIITRNKKADTVAPVLNGHSQKEQKSILNF